MHMYVQTYNSSDGYAASSAKARLRMPQELLRCLEEKVYRILCIPTTPQSALLTAPLAQGSLYEVRTYLIQRHRPTPPLCKAPEAAAQRRCGDRLWRWRDC